MTDAAPGMKQERIGLLRYFTGLFMFFFSNLGIGIAMSVRAVFQPRLRKVVPFFWLYFRITLVQVARREGIRIGPPASRK